MAVHHTRITFIFVMEITVPDRLIPIIKYAFVSANVFVGGFMAEIVERVGGSIGSK